LRSDSFSKLKRRKTETFVHTVKKVKGRSIAKVDVFMYKEHDSFVVSDNLRKLCGDPKKSISRKS